MSMLLNQGVAYIVGLAVDEFPASQQLGQLLGKRTTACADSGPS
jgi:hypothetical protein